MKKINLLICFVLTFLSCHKAYAFGFEGTWEYEDTQADYSEYYYGAPYIFLITDMGYLDGEIRLLGFVRNSQIIYIVEVGSQDTEMDYSCSFLFKGKYAKERAEEWFTTAVSKINKMGKVMNFITELDTIYNWFSIGTLPGSRESKKKIFEYGDEEEKKILSLNTSN